MALRFRKSFKLAPGIRINAGSGGLSWNLGPRGASLSLGKRGAYFNTGIPGTGLSSRTRLDGPAASPPRATPKTVSVKISVEVSDTGEIRFTDGNGNSVNETFIEAAKKQQGDVIRGLVQRKCFEINRQIEALGELHYDTPSPTLAPACFSVTFSDARPVEPFPVTYGILARLFAKQRAKIDEVNATAQRRYATAMRAWSMAKEEFNQENDRIQTVFAGAMRGEPQHMQSWLEKSLQDIVWPQETNVDLAISEDGVRATVDVDLPEIENMPNKTASAAQRQFRLTVKDIGPAQIQKLYMRHVHAIGFRLLGETFSQLPTVREIILSGYSQRPSKATGQVSDEYLYSVRCERAEWATMNFTNLTLIDPVESLGQFELRRNMSKTGVFKPIEPFEFPD